MASTEVKTLLTEIQTQLGECAGYLCLAERRLRAASATTAQLHCVLGQEAGDVKHENVAGARPKETLYQTATEQKLIVVQRPQLKPLNFSELSAEKTSIAIPSTQNFCEAFNSLASLSDMQIMEDAYLWNQAVGAQAHDDEEIRKLKEEFQFGPSHGQ